MTRIIVLAGGTSDEKEVSLRSGKAVANALKAAKFDVSIIDPGSDATTYLKQLQQADVVFPALHGTGGEDGSMQALLETSNVKYVGSDSLASALCFNKAEYSHRLAGASITIPKTELVDLAGYESSALRLKPHVLKPNDGGSSIDTFIIKKVPGLDRAVIETAFKKHQQMMLQELIVGTEITVGVLLRDGLPVIEIIPPADQEFDYENKYNGATQELCPPVHVSAEAQQQARTLALKIHELTGCRHFSRTDMIVTEDGELYVLETNTIPGLTAQSLFPKAAATAGVPMSELVTKLVQAAMSEN